MNNQKIVLMKIIASSKLTVTSWDKTFNVVELWTYTLFWDKVWEIVNMFTDETLDLIGAESTWRKSHQQTQESVSKKVCLPSLTRIVMHLKKYQSFCVMIYTCVFHSRQRSCQTLPVHTAEAETQAKDVLDNSSQTQDRIIQTLSLDQDMSLFPGLLDFLLRVEDVVIKELVKNSKSHAFDGVWSELGGSEWVGESLECKIYS